MTGGILPKNGSGGAGFSPDGGRWTLRWRPRGFPDVDAWVTGRSVRRENEAPFDPPPAAVLEQVHGTRIETVRAPGVSPACDASVTLERGLALTVRVADCIPLFLVGPNGLGVAHAGWRGLAGGIVQGTVAALHERAGDAPELIEAFVGPSIGPCCFEVGPDVAGAFDAAYRRPGPLFERRADRPHVDLWQACRGALREAGLPDERITLSGVCTRCHQHLLNSYRGSGGRAGRIEAWLRRNRTD